jgi:hypothetical protein
MAPKEQLARGARIAAPVRVTIPISVAYDLEKFQRALANLATQVGHARRCSGVEVTLLTAREFVVDPTSLQVKEAVTEL